MAFPSNKIFPRSDRSRRWTLAIAVFFGADCLFSQTLAMDPGTFKKMSLEELMDLDVTSVAKQAESYWQASAALQVITGDQIRRSGAFNLPEALRLADNLDVAQESSAGWKISARGFNASVGNKLLVLIDGRSVYTPLLSGVIWNMQDQMLGDLDRIEVISGPGGTLWGANAVNGVINIMSKGAKDTQGFFYETGGGSQSKGFLGLRYGGALEEKVHYRVYAKYFDRREEVYPDGTGARDQWNRAQGGFRIDSEASEQERFTLQGDVFSGDGHAVPGGQGTAPATGYASGGNLLGRWTRALGEGSEMTFQAYYDRARLEAPFQSSGPIPAGVLVDNLDTLDLDLQVGFPLDGSNRIVWGLGYRFTHDVAHSAPVVAFLPEVLDQGLFSGFLQGEIQLAENLFFTLGSKVEHNDYTGFEFEPNLRLQWNTADKQMVWCAVSKAIRAPARYDRDLFQPDPSYGTFLGGNSTFRSENVMAYELGYRAQLSPEVSTSISTFFNNYDDLRSLTYTPVVFVPLYFANDLRAQTYGVEWSLDVQVLEGWRLHGGYDHLKEKVWAKPGRMDLFNGYNETADPENQVFLRSSMDLPLGTELDLAFRWIDLIHNNDGPTPGLVWDYAELDVRLGLHATENVEISIVGRNLLNDRHVETGFPGSKQEAILRTIQGKATLRF